MVDAANAESLAAAKEGLHTLLSKPQLAGIPVSLFIMLHLPDILDSSSGKQERPARRRHCGLAHRIIVSFTTAFRFA